MTGKKAVLFYALLIFPIFAAAQSNDLAVTLGGSFSTGAQGTPACEAIPICPATGDLNIGPGFTVSGNLAHRLADFKAASLHLELPFTASPSRSGSTFFNRDFSSFFFTPSLRVELLPGGGVSPFLSAGVGLGHFSGQGSDTQWATQFGGGLDFKTRFPHLGFRVEVRDYLHGRPSIGALANVTSGHLQQVFAGGGMVFRF